MRELLDEDLYPELAEIVGTWTAGLPEIAGDYDGALLVDALSVDLPVELQLVAGDAGLALHASSPTQKIATTIMPVWHRLRISYRSEEGDDADGG